jgi:hypothetical protein
VSRITRQFPSREIASDSLVVKRKLTIPKT